MCCRMKRCHLPSRCWPSCVCASADVWDSCLRLILSDSLGSAHPMDVFICTSTGKQWRVTEALLTRSATLRDLRDEGSTGAFPLPGFTDRAVEV